MHRKPSAGDRRLWLYRNGLAFHILFWIMYVVSLVLELQEGIARKGWLFFAGPIFSYCALTGLLVYSNTLVLIPRLLERGKRLFYFSLLLVVVVAYTLARSRMQLFWDAWIWPDEPMKISSYFKWNLFYSIWFLLVSTLLSFTQKWSEQKQQVKNIQISQLQTELKYLRSQINPHFLFNGLNTIYGNIEVSNEKAREIMVQFSDLLRYTLYEADVDQVDLASEIKYLQDYVALQRARSNENLKIDFHVHYEDGTIRIAPLLFLAFVENAFKYASRDDAQPNNVQIELKQQGKEIHFSCRNSFDADLPPGKGIGLNNVIRRLELLYHNRYKLKMDRDHHLFHANLDIYL